MGQQLIVTEDGKLREGLNQKTREWEVMLVWVSPEDVSSENWRLVELLTEEVTLVEPQGEVFLEEVWLKTTVEGA